MAEEYLPLVGRNPKSKRLERKKSTVSEEERERYSLGEREMWEL